MRSLGILLVLGTAMPAHADEDHARADALFAEAQALKSEGNKLAACARFDDALRYNPHAVGTLLNVGLCNEEAGKLATASKHYRLARDLAREHSLTEHRDAAAERLDQIEPRVPHLTITFVAQAPGAKLVIDDVVIPIESAGDIRVDPGSRHVVVTAPGRVPYSVDVDLAVEERKTVEIPELGLPVTVSQSRRTVGKVLTFAGGGLVATSIVIGLIARSRYLEPFDTGKCTDRDRPSDEGGPSCSEEGLTQINKAMNLGNAGTAVAVVGGAALAAGVILWVTAPKERANRDLSFVPTLNRDMAGIAAVGRF
jgi:hypothetical protein